METLYEIIKKYSNGKGENTMWKSVKIISDTVDLFLDDVAKDSLAREIYSAMAGGHYDESFAMGDVKRMYYVDENGEKKYAPYWTLQQTDMLYQGVKSRIPHYNTYDFFVAMNMIKSDNIELLKKWFPNDNETECAMKVRDMAVVWLDDPDNPYGSEKIWRYLNSK